MKARALIANAAYAPADVKILCKAFDEAWKVLAREIGSDKTAVEAARFRLANLILGFAKDGIGDGEQIKRDAIQIMRAVR